MRGSFGEQIKHYAPDVRNIDDKDGLLNLLRASMDESGAQLLGPTQRFRKAFGETPP
jgi:hypothetical protein